MEINAQIIEGIRYKPILKSRLVEIPFESFDINSANSSCLITFEQNRFAISKWVSPKRTRSYPYERVYNTLSVSKRITVIPVIKDEGLAGDRDFLQWDTISLMSLLDVYVILAYYESAETHRNRTNKISKQRFNNAFVLSKIKEIANYHSSALHWNLKELKDTPQILQKAKQAYQNIAARTAVAFHSEKGLSDFAEVIAKDFSAFMQSSRLKAGAAQLREFQTFQPKESLSTLTKARITITNYLGGKYFFTVDETKIEEERVYLIESKHSKNSKLPSIGDIKDGLLKIMLYTNLENVSISGVLCKSSSILRLTSERLKGLILSTSPKPER